MNGAYVLASTCTGPNRNCRAAHKAGRSVHVIPAHTGIDTPRLIMPTYHYATSADGIEAIDLAERTAPTVTCDADLYACRRMGIPHYLPVGWVDPSRRNTCPRVHEGPCGPDMGCPMV
jgi:hypothetical protein